MAEKVNKPKISVVLPVYNGATTLKRAVDSILDQDDDHWQLIIINDGSTDQTKELLKRFDDPRINSYTIPHSGISRALNFGIRMSSGQYIARMDADDVSTPERLSSQARYLDEHEETGLVSGKVIYMGNRNTQAGYAHYVDSINAILTEEDIMNKRFYESPFAHPSVMFRKALTSRYGGYCEQSVPEDYELWLRWLQAGVKMHKLSHEVLLWYDYPERLSRKAPNYSLPEFFKVKAHYFNLWLRNQENKDREIWVFGCGKDVNKRLKAFIKRGLNVARFIDVKKRTDISRYIYYRDIPGANEGHSPIILSFVSDREGRRNISEYLNDLGYREGRDWFIMA